MSDMDGIGTRDEWYDERMVDDDSVAAGLLPGRKEGESEMLLSEILGVDLDTDFGVEGHYGKFRVRVNTGHEFFVISNGKGAYNTVVNGATAYGIIDAAPDGIIHLPPSLTDEQREQLRAIWTLGGRWIAKDKTGNIFAYGSKPQKIMICSEWHNDKEGECFTVMRELSVCAIVSWSDPEPFDVGKALGVGE